MQGSDRLIRDYTISSRELRRASEKIFQELERQNIQPTNNAKDSSSLTKKHLRGSINEKVRRNRSRS